MRTRRIAWVIASVLGASAVACSALLGLDDRTLRASDAGSDAVPDGPTTCVDAGFCACNKHDFCEDFDSIKNVAELKTRWTNEIGFPPSPVAIPPSRTDLDPLTVVPPSPPNAFLARTEVKSGTGGLAAAFVQIDGTKIKTQLILGVKVSFLLRIDALEPNDAGVQIKDSGIQEAVGVVELVSPTGSNGVGMLLTENGGFVGYALNINDLLKTSLAQGLPFYGSKISPPGSVFLPFTVIVAPRNSKELIGATCTQGPIVTLGDADPDSGAGTQPDSLVVYLIPPLGLGSKVCQILGGDLLDPTWVRNPVVAIGSVQAGMGVFQAAFDNVTVDFLTE